MRQEITSLAHARLDWVSFARAASESLNSVVPFDRCSWHTVDPSTVLFTGSLHRGVQCSGRWVAEHEYVIDDVNKWWFLARSGRMAGATSLATYGDLSRSPRHRSQEACGIGDELRGAFVADGNYWGAAGFLRDSAGPWFTEADVQFLASLSSALGSGLRSALLRPVSMDEVPVLPDGPGVVVFDQGGRAEYVSPTADQLIRQMVDEPAQSAPGDSVAVQAVAARVRARTRDGDPLHPDARSRVQTRSGSWLLLYGTPLAGERTGRTAVVIQPAAGSEVAPLVALAYGLSARECQVVQLCMEGRSTREMATALHVSPYTVQDHLKSIFDKTGVRSRHELVGRVFLEHCLPRWDDLAGTAVGWTGWGSDPAAPSGSPPGQRARVAPPSTGMTVPVR